METHEILDRLELIYPTSSFIADLRKALISDDQYALFRLIQGQRETAFIEALRKLKNDDTFDKDCISRGQLKSKLWLINELQKIDKHLGTVFLCAGWYATLATLLFESPIKIKKIRSFDIDDSCRKIAETFNKPWVLQDWMFKPVTQDIHDIDFNSHDYTVTRADGTQCSLTDVPDTIINTSCEHILDFNSWYSKIPNGKLIVLQTNNFFEIEEHVNCVKDLHQFSLASPMTEVLYEGELQLEKYCRYMRIGIK